MRTFRSANVLTVKGSITDGFTLYLSGPGMGTFILAEGMTETQVVRIARQLNGALTELINQNRPDAVALTLPKSLQKLYG